MTEEKGMNRPGSTPGFSRRDFLKGTATGAVGVAAMGILGGCASTNAGAETAPAPEYMTSELADKKWNFEIPPAPIPESDIAETFTADVIIVGAGTSGLVTGNSAAESGATVMVISASKAPVARGGSNFAVYCKAMERVGVPRVDPWVFQKEIYAGANNIDQKKWYKFYNHSEEAMNWAIDIMEGAGYGVTVEYGTPMEPNNLYHQPTAAVGWAPKEKAGDKTALVTAIGMYQPLFAGRLAERLVEKGGKVFYNTIGKQLVREDQNTGRVTAVIALRQDGTYAKYVGKKAVVLATGDFSADRDMMRKYCPSAASCISEETYAAPANYDVGFQYGGLLKGEGHKMGLWVGAAWQKSFPNCPMGASTMMPGPSLLYGCHWGLMVDRNGERFMNEYAIAPMAGVTGALQEGGACYAIWDTGYAAYLNALDPSKKNADSADALAETIEMWEKSVEAGNYVKADTLEKLIETLGLPANTIDTVKRYNEMAKNGKDEEFYKPAAHLREIKEGPFYGQKTKDLIFLTVLGGLRTNAKMQVCDEEDNPIPGLYNVGTMIGDLFSGTYTFQVEGANYGMACLTYGYLTGKYIAQNEK